MQIAACVQQLKSPRFMLFGIAWFFAKSRIQHLVGFMKITDARHFKQLYVYILIHL